MKCLLIGGIVIVVGLVVAAAASISGDRSIMVPPPDARAEAFVRELATHRYKLARRYVAADMRRHISAEMLQQAFGRVTAQIGTVQDVQAQLLWSDRSHALARAEVRGTSGVRLPLQFGLVWEHGRWAINELPSLLQVPGR